MVKIDLEIIKKTIAKQLKELRKLKRETQKDVINAIGNYYLSERSYKSYENGTEKNLPSLEKLILLANHFDVPVDTLLSGKTYTDDDSFTWESTMKRLNRLIFTMVLSVQETSSDEIKKNPNLMKYFFLSFDKQIEIYLDSILSFCKKKNFDFYRRFKKISVSPKDFDKLIGDFVSDKSNLLPGPHRFEKVINSSGSTMEEWLKIRNKESSNYWLFYLVKHLS